MAQQSETINRPGIADERLRAENLQQLARNQVRSTPGFWLRAWRRFRRNKPSMVGLAVLVLIVLFVAAAPLISEYITGFTYQNNNLRAKLAPVGAELTVNAGRADERVATFYLGADGNGRDVLTRLAYGGRVSLIFAVLTAAAIIILGGLIGAVAGFFGGFIDSFLMRIADALLAFPLLVLLILVSSFYQPGIVVLALFIGAFGWPGVSRLIRGEVLSLRQRDYVEAARVSGASNSRIISRHIMPNVLPIVVVWASLAIPAVILTEAALSYLGLGVQVPTPSWGNMLQDAKQFYRQSWTLVFIPGFAIYLTVLVINLVGVGLRDALDPRLNE
ncbi:MAG: ABC transporter permease [Thermomicrobiales bacterium]